MSNIPIMPFGKHCVSGLVVLYNSDIQVVENINTYLFQIDHLFVVDNSEIISDELVKLIKVLPNTTYLSNGGNMGVAYALNKAADTAIAAGYQFLLTMDDDSSLPDGAVQTMLAYVNRQGIEKLGLIAGQSVPRLFENTIKSVSYTITSGNLLNLSAYQDCGPFMNELFIDFVDHEYCFRLMKNKYKIIEINNIYLNHRLGKRKFFKIINNKSFNWISHSPLRIYYKTRNCLYIMKNYDFITSSLKYKFYKEIVKDLFKILFLEDDKKNRFAYFFQAISDGFKGNLGKKIPLK